MTKAFKILVVIILLLPFSKAAYPQYATGFDLGVGMQSTDLDSGILVDLVAKYVHWFNPCAGVSVGGLINTSRMEMGFTSPAKDNISYFHDDFILNLNGIAGIKFATPVYKGFGLATDLNLVFAPIPFNLMSFDKRTYREDGSTAKESNKVRVVYTRFSPSYNIQLSVFYEKQVKEKNEKIRLAVGVGMSNYNPYNAFYYGRVDGIQVRDYMKVKPSKQSFMVFIRLSGLDLK